MMARTEYHFESADHKRVEPITTCGTDWWYGFDENGYYKGTRWDTDLAHLVGTTVSRVLAFEVPGKRTRWPDGIDPALL